MRKKRFGRRMRRGFSRRRGRRVKRYFSRGGIRL